MSTPKDADARRYYRAALRRLEVIRSFLFVSSWSPDLRYEPGPGDSVEAARFLKEAKAIVIWADRSI